jgi:hypothetical protein
MFKRLLIVLAVEAWGSVWGLVAAEKWTSCENSPAQFTVQCPSSWRLSDKNGRVLNIVNFPPDQQVHGVVLPARGAEITVLKQPDYAPTLEEWIQHDLLNYRASSRREIEVGATVDGCRRLVEVKWRWDAGGAPEVYFQEAAYYCVAETAVYQIRLTYWSDNPSGPELLAVALRIARSLKVR